MKAIKQFFGAAAACVFEILVGILLLIDPTGFTGSIIISCGCILMIWGVVCIIGYFRADPETAAINKGLFRGLCLLLAGGFCTRKWQWFITLLPLVALIYGAAILVTGVSKVQWTIDLLRLKRGKWYLAAISAAISILCGSVIITNPFTTTAVLWTFTGVSLIAEAIIDIITFLFSSRKPKQTDVVNEAE